MATLAYPLVPSMATTAKMDLEASVASEASTVVLAKRTDFSILASTLEHMVPVVST